MLDGNLPLAIKFVVFGFCRFDYLQLQAGPENSTFAARAAHHGSTIFKVSEMLFFTQPVKFATLKLSPSKVFFLTFLLLVQWIKFHYCV